MRTLLIVDDEELFRESLADGLRALDRGWRVVAVDNGKSAEQVLETETVDLVLTDLHMPVVDGFELLAYLVEHRPWLPVLVMTAYGTAEVSDRLRRLGFGGFIEKPIEFESLTQRIAEVFASEAAGFVRGIPLPTFLQVLELEKKTCSLRVTAGGKVGHLHFVDGACDDAEAGALCGEEAAAEIVCWEGAAIEILVGTREPTRRIRIPTRHLLLESFHLRDERAAGQRPAPPPADDLRAAIPASAALPHDQENDMGAQDTLKELSAIDGFAGAGVYTPTGEPLAMLSAGTGFTKEIGVLANNVLRNAQKASVDMGAGRGQQVHVEAEKAHILVRCLNEGNDPLKSEPGKAHIHLVLALSDDGSIGFAKMKMNQTIERLANEFRL